MNKKRKRILIIIVLILLAIVLVICIGSKKEKSGSRDELSVKAILQAQLERGNLQNELGESNIYPEYYTARHFYDMTEDEVKAGLLENKAMQWFAQKNNINVSNKELNKYLQDEIADFKDSEEYDEYSEAAKSLNTTFEDIVVNDSESYRDILIKNKLYEKYILENQGTLPSNENTDEIQDNEQWNTFLKDVIEQYKKQAEDSYEVLLNDFKKCESLVDDNVTDINKIKESGDMAGEPVDQGCLPRTVY